MRRGCSAALLLGLLTGAADVPPARLPVRVHRVEVVDGYVYVEESERTPNLPPGLTVRGDVA